MTVHDMDVMAELPGKDLQRVTAVSAHTPLEAINSYLAKSSNGLTHSKDTDKKCNQPSFQG
ncbi:hypothetical protein ACVBKF_02280 [Shewanella sp. 0m-11]